MSPAIHELHISVIGVTKRFGKVTALSDVSLDIGPGMFGLLGPNGAGKTTLMRILATLLEPSQGKVIVSGLELSSHKDWVRGELGYLPQEFGLYKKLTGEEMLDFVAILKGITDVRERKRQVEEVLHTVGLWDDRRRLTREYSGGMKQRMGIAQALLGAPKLLIVDEPTVGLDPEERVRFRNLLSDISANRVVILSTHIVADVEFSCQDVAVLAKGRLVFRGTPASLAKTAQGLVWRTETDEAGFEKVRTASRVLRTRRDNGRIIARVLCEGNPAGVGVPVEPTLEDGYFVLMEGTKPEVAGIHLS